MKLYSTVVAILVLSVIVTVNGLLRSEFEQALTRVNTAITENGRSLVAGLVRLIFHDCVGGCDGCINLNNPSNGGLDVYINTLEPVYQELKATIPQLGRADFWALAAVEGVRVATRRGRNNPAESLVTNFKTGRVDCGPTSTTSVVRTFPSAYNTSEQTLAYFSEHFGFDAAETVAALGAHSLGRAHRGASGFTDAWDSTPTRLDNQFYTDLLNMNTQIDDLQWTQTEICNRRRTVCNFQWSSVQNTMMLNSDMELVSDLGDIAEEEGRKEADCAYNSCPAQASGTRAIVETFAQDNDEFLRQFVATFQKLIENGNSSLQNLE